MNRLLVIVFGFASFTCIHQNQSFAQLSAPTLNAGLSAVTGQRGTIDIALLTEMISDKQDELRKELLQREVLRRMKKQSFALTNYTYSNLSALLTLNDKSAIERELLAQTSILALQIGIAETTLQLCFRPNGNAVKNGRNISATLLKSMGWYIENKYGISKTSDNMSNIITKLPTKIGSTSFMILFGIDNIIESMVKDEVKEKFKVSQKNLSYSSIFLDCVYDVCRQNKGLQDLGFVKISPVLSESYQDDNKYVVVGDTMDALEPYLKSIVDLLVKYHPLILDFMNDDALTVNSLFDNVNELDCQPENFIQYKWDTMTEMANSMSISLNEYFEDGVISVEVADGLSEQLNFIRAGMKDFETRTRNNNELINTNDFTFIRNYVNPFASKMIAMGILDEDDLLLIDRLQNTIYFELMADLKSDISKRPDLSGLPTISFGDYAHLIRIITSLSQLDNVYSYEHIFNTLAQVGINTLKRSDMKYVRDIIYFVDAYSDIKLDSNKMNVDVEGLLLKLVSLYESKVDKDINAYMGIGLSQTLDVNYGDDQYKLVNHDTDTLNSLSFASEKIGLKIKLLNTKRIRSKNRSELDWFLPKTIRGNNPHVSALPIVSDLYVFGYGSGLLYNIANTTTEGKNFDMPMIGFGAGIAFFNSLDFSIWRNSPMMSAESFGQSISRRAFWGFSFDVKLTEYWSRAREKRQIKKYSSKNGKS